MSHNTQQEYDNDLINPQSPADVEATTTNLEHVSMLSPGENRIVVEPPTPTTGEETGPPQEDPEVDNVPEAGDDSVTSPGNQKTDPTQLPSTEDVENDDTASDGETTSGDGKGADDDEGYCIPSGPIKGFDSKKIYLNLYDQVQQDWEKNASTAILVHYLDGGYNPYLATNVRAIENDLRQIYKIAFGAKGEIDPIVVHPTAAAKPSKKRKGAPPYLFHVSNIPTPFREYLIKTAIFEVQSELKVLFIEDTNPVPHDYAVTLGNYNLPVETGQDREKAIEKVRESVTKELFDEDTTAANYVKCFISADRDNLPPSWSVDRVLNFMRNSVKVELIQIIFQNTKTLTPVYNVYIFPPTKVPDRLESWRQWIAKQSFFAGAYGVGEKFEPAFNCTHCKSIDHPTGLCPYYIKDGDLILMSRSWPRNQ